VLFLVGVLEVLDADDREEASDVRLGVGALELVELHGVLLVPGRRAA
jgi:hypothetical protein